MTKTEPMRLQKWIALQGLASRREAETWIQAGRIKVNGKVVKELGTRVDPDKDVITLDGKSLVKDAPPRVYWLLNKPDKVLTSRKAQGERRTIYDLPALKKVPFLVSPIGRLDFRTEGLLLLSNDGELVHRLSHPSFKMPRHYQVLINGTLTSQQEQVIRKGVPLEDGPTKNVKVKRLVGEKIGEAKGSWYLVTVEEGRNRLVRRIFEHFEFKVVRLVRTGFGDLRLPASLAPGEYLQLTRPQIQSLKKATDLA